MAVCIALVSLCWDCNRRLLVTRGYGVYYDGIGQMRWLLGCNRLSLSVLLVAVVWRVVFVCSVGRDGGDGEGMEGMEEMERGWRRWRGDGGGGEGMEEVER